MKWHARVLPFAHQIDEFQIDHYSTVLLTECNCFLGIHRLIPPLISRGLALDGRLATFARSYPNRFVEGYHENFPIADTSSLRALFDGVDDLGHHIVRNDYLDFYLGHEINHVCRASVDFFLPTRTAK